jgi:hypothetical protein
MERQTEAEEKLAFEAVKCKPASQKARQQTRTANA